MRNSLLFLRRQQATALHCAKGARLPKATSFAEGNIVCAKRKSARVILEQATRRDSSLRSRMTVGGWGSEGSRAAWNQCEALYGISRRQKRNDILALQA